MAGAIQRAAEHAERDREDDRRIDLSTVKVHGRRFAAAVTPIMKLLVVVDHP